MSINDRQVFTPGRNLSQEELQRMLGLRPADWATPYEGGIGDASGGSVDPTRSSQSWALDTGRFAPTLYYEPTYSGANGRQHDNGARYTTGSGRFQIVQPRNVSTWGNSDSYDVWDEQGVWRGAETDGTALRGLVNMGLLAAGANNLPPAALKGAGTGALVTAASGGDYSDITSAAATGAATGTLAHGINTYGAEQGWSPAATRALSSGTTAALRGGGVQDILQNAAAGGFSGYVNSEGLTGNAAVDRAIASGGSTAIRGGDGRSVLLNSVDGALSGANSKRGLLGGNDDALSEENIVRFEGDNMGEFDWDAWLREQMDSGANFYPESNAVDQRFWEANTTDPSGEPDYSNEGRNYPTTESTQGDGGSPVNSSMGQFDLGSVLRKLFTTSGSNGQTQMNGLLPLLLGGTLGALGGKDRQATDSRAPWEPMQPYLKGLAADGANIYNQLRAQPFNAAQKAGYSNLGGLLDLYGQQAAGLLQGPGANASGANQFSRSDPKRGLLGSEFRFWGTPQMFGDFGTSGGR